MEFKIDLEKLTEDQLEALRAINNSVVETELKRRIEASTYTDEEARNHKIFSDLYKAYFYIKPMYDNMRNTDVKKTLTQSEILTVMEKVFRYADKKGIVFEKFEGEPTKVIEAAEKVEQEPTPIEKAIEEATPIQVAPIVAPVTEQEPTWEPGGGVEVEQPTPVTEPVAEPVAEPVVEPVAEPVAEPAEVTPASIDEIVTSPVEKMSTEELNKILANIPTVEKI